MTRRTTAVLLAATGMALPATANAEVIQDFTISATPSKASTAKVKRSVNLKISTGTRDTTGAQPPSTKFVRILFPRGSRWNGGLFPTCSPTSISQAKSTADCPAGSIIGSGKAAGLAPGPITQNDLKISIANGGPSSLSMFVEGTSPLRIQSNIAVKISKLSGKFGLRTDIPIPENLQEPAPGVPVAVTLFSISIKKTRKVKGVSRGIIEVDRCDGGKWYGEGSFDYANGTKYSASRTLTCSKG